MELDAPVGPIDEPIPAVGMHIEEAKSEFLPEFKDQDPANPDYVGFGRRCEDAARSLLSAADLGAVSLRDHPLVAKANLVARLNTRQYSDTDMVRRCQDLWATIRVTPRPPPSLIHSMDLAVEGGDGTLYVGAENDRRGRKRMRTAYVEMSNHANHFTAPSE